MKIAVSIPDKLFKQADKLAKKLGMSRSKLYATALERLFSERQGNEVTAKLNALYGPDGLDNSLDPVMAELQFRSLQKSEAGHEKW